MVWKNRKAKRRERLRKRTEKNILSSYFAAWFDLPTDLTCRAQVANCTSHAGSGFVPAGSANLSLLWPRVCRTDITYTIIWQWAANIEESPHEIRARPHAEQYECNSTERKLYKQAQQRIQRQCGRQTGALCNHMKHK